MKYRIIKKYYRRDDEKKEVKHYFQVQKLASYFNFLHFSQKLNWIPVTYTQAFGIDTYDVNCDFDTLEKAQECLANLEMPVYGDELVFDPESKMSEKERDQWESLRQHKLNQNPWKPYTEAKYFYVGSFAGQELGIMTSKSEVLDEARNYFKKNPPIFIECDECIVKPGSPVLCESCLKRRVIYL